MKKTTLTTIFVLLLILLIIILILIAILIGYVRPSNPKYLCDANIYNCDDFKTHAKAQAAFKACGGVRNDIHWLDGDDDGIACEHLP